MQRTKTVRFYRPLILDQNDVEQDIPEGFWSAIMDATDGKPPAERRLAKTSGDLYGRTSEPGGRNRYLRIGRLRGREEFPDVVEIDDSSDAFEALELEGNKLLFESALVVPFGLSNRIAVLGPPRGLVTASALEDWVTFVGGMQKTSLRVALTPEYDPRVRELLTRGAVGVSRLNVRFPAGVDLDRRPKSPTNDTDSLRAIRSASKGRPHEASLEITLSTGHRKPVEALADLKETAEYLLEAGVDKLSATMQVRGADGELRSETRDLLQEDLSIQVKYSVTADEAEDELSALDAIAQAIDLFHRRIG